MTGFLKSYNFTPTIEKTVDFCRRSFALPILTRVCECKSHNSIAGPDGITGLVYYVF